MGDDFKRNFPPGTPRDFKRRFPPKPSGEHIVATPPSMQSPKSSQSSTPKEPNKGKRSIKIPAEIAGLAAIVIGVCFAIAAPAEQLVGRLIALAICLVLGIALALWADIPTIRVSAQARWVVAIVWIVAMAREGQVIWQASQSPSPLMYVNLDLINTLKVKLQPGTRQVHWPGDPSIDNRIYEKFHSTGYRIASTPVGLRITLHNSGSHPWRDYKVKVRLHYEMRSLLALRSDQWARLDTIDQDFTFTNCSYDARFLVQGFCPDPVDPNGAVTYDIINTSTAYVAAEFSNRATVQELGSNTFTDANVTFGGALMLPISAIVLFPYRDWETLTPRSKTSPRSRVRRTR